MTTLDVNITDVAAWQIIGDRYLVELAEVEDTVIGGILIPNSGELTRGWACGKIVNRGHNADDHYSVGVNPGHAHRLDASVVVPMFFNVGDFVVFERLSGKDFLVGGKKYRMVNQVDVLAKVEG